jgi:hypothetical protein
MSDTLTANLNLVKPENGASDDTWGTKFNANLEAIDAIFAAAGGGTSVGLNIGAGKKLTLTGTLQLTGTSVIAWAPGCSHPFVENGQVGFGVNQLLQRDARGNVGMQAAPVGTWDSGGGLSSISVNAFAVNLRPTQAIEWGNGNCVVGGDDFMAMTRNSVWTGGGLGSMKTTFASPSWATIMGRDNFMVAATPNSAGTPGVGGLSALEWMFSVDRLGNAFSRVQFGVSDRRQKTDLRVITRPLEKLEALGGYTFEMNNDSSRRHAGVIAQEVQGVLPEAVADMGNLLTVNLAGPVALLIECVKQLAARVELLEGTL